MTSYDYIRVSVTSWHFSVSFPSHHWRTDLDLVISVEMRYFSKVIYAGSLWGLANSDLAWSAVSPYQSHSLWPDTPPLHPGQYQPDLFGFSGEIWGGTRGAGHGRQLLQYQKQAKKRRRVATAAQRRAANIRERRRMFNLNESFDRLRSKVIPIIQINAF